MNNYPGCTLHQIGPYIGKIRPSLARELVLSFSKRGDWLWDPFCGSGTIPLEARLLSRHVIAADINPYACALTRAKLHAPISEEKSLSQLNAVVEKLNGLPETELSGAPQHIRKFFHEETLKQIIPLMLAFKTRRLFFHIGCLIDILHHQRPGFLSYPASHLVPYLRDRLFPKDKYPEAYQYRDPIPRLIAKIKRSLKSPPPVMKNSFKVVQRSALTKYLPDSSIDTIITSPPYMDALDYIRDNRLRLWFLGLKDHATLRSQEIRKISTFNKDMLLTLHLMSRVLKPGGVCILILGEVKRSKRKYDVPDLINHLVKAELNNLTIENQWVEEIPPHKRTRKGGRATQKETIIVLRWHGKGESHGCPKSNA